MAIQCSGNKARSTYAWRSSNMVEISNSVHALDRKLHPLRFLDNFIQRTAKAVADLSQRTETNVLQQHSLVAHAQQLMNENTLKSKHLITNKLGRPHPCLPLSCPPFLPPPVLLSHPPSLCHALLASLLHALPPALPTYLPLSCPYSLHTSIMPSLPPSLHHSLPPNLTPPCPPSLAPLNPPSLCHTIRLSLHCILPLLCYSSFHLSYHPSLPPSVMPSLLPSLNPSLPPSYHPSLSLCHTSCCHYLPPTISHPCMLYTSAIVYHTVYNFLHYTACTYKHIQ